MKNFRSSLFESVSWLLPLLRYIMIALAALLTLSIFGSLVSTALSKNNSYLVLLILIGVLCIVGAAAYFSIPKKDGPKKLSDLLKFKPLVMTSAALITSLLMLPDLLALWEPSPATSVDVERDGNKTRAELQKLSDRQNDIGPEALIFAKMPGLWGDSLSCDVAYRFTITGNKLVIIAERRPSGTVPFRLDAEILATNPKSPDTIRIQVFGPIKKDGSREIGSADFTYLKRGIGEELLWNDAVLGKQVRLTPCAVAKGRS